MIRRHPQRSSRRQPQDFHFYAAPDPLRGAISSTPQGAQNHPVANLESQLTRPAAIPPQLSSASDPAEIPPAAPSLPPVPAPAGDAGNPQSKPRTRKRAKARLATPRRNRSKSTRQPSPAANSRSDHERHCTICSHPDRAEIENEFMHWHTIGHIAYDYKVSRAAIYRHAYALDLFSRRNHNLRFALGHLIERVQDVDPTADSVVRAIHAFARINNDGDWIEPPAHVIVSSGGIHREAAAPPSRRPITLDAQTISNVIDVTPEPALPEAPDALPRDGMLPETVNRVETDATL